MNLNYKKKLKGKHFHKRNYTDHIYHDYLTKHMPKFLFEILPNKYFI